MFIGQRLKEQREKQGFSQQELGDVLGISRSAIQKQESGKSKTIDTLSLELLAQKLNCSPAYLMGWTNDPQSELNTKPATNLDDGLSDKKKRLLDQVAIMSDTDVDALTIIVEQVIQRRKL